MKETAVLLEEQSCSSMVDGAGGAFFISREFYDVATGASRSFCHRF